MSFYDKLKALCEKKSVAPSVFARELGIPQSSVATWKKRGSLPKYETLKKIADYFEVTVDSLIGLSDEETEEIDYTVKRIQKRTGQDSDKLRKSFLEARIEGYPHKTYAETLKKAGEAVISSFEDFTDEQLEEFFLERYNELNRLGRIEAVKRMFDLSEVERYLTYYDD